MAKIYIRTLQKTDEPQRLAQPPTFHTHRLHTLAASIKYTTDMDPMISFS